MTPIYIHMQPHVAVEPGMSHFWGNPELPEGFEFPTATDEYGEEWHLRFICQINLADIAPWDKDNMLPHSGLLAVFADIDYYMGESDETSIMGFIGDRQYVKVAYFKDIERLHEVCLVDINDEPISPEPIAITFDNHHEPLSDEHALLAHPDHRPWETWDKPYDNWEILLQIDSCEGSDFNLNFMDCGVLNILISPKDLRNRRFDRVRPIVLST